MKEWIFSSFDVLLPTVVSTVLVYALVIIYTRIFGLRSFSKMSAFDFAMTVAVGTLLSSTIINKSPSVVQSAVALLSLYFLQLIVAVLRQRLSWFNNAVDNQPLLLMDGPNILHENLRKAQLSEDDLRSKLREANVLNYQQVKAVVFETTGDVSVLHTGEDAQLDTDILKGVQGVSKLA
ncbi:uncharacterized membrane protein YcaP (DUF421 family) [Catalinimonas alkaloidigena]|uniref:DUF421 domain-containing protein n=1 Tax=Catalinimonas alkaloidigena TaxID=1075417 RepID=UPI002405B6A7|nr:YetF domain-containing protein [Catalinimonas alkaloidigena]MDF9800510.1 uncharacterized membrane protein YcaP (DUF421 family) [Catalinimonas alkaloidigena]